MSRVEPAGGSLWVERMAGLGDAGIWVVTEAGHERRQPAEVEAWALTAERIFAARPEIASVSMVASNAVEAGAVFWPVPGVAAAQADTAVLPLCLLNGRVADLVGLGPDHDGKPCSIATFQRLIATATLKGLVHLWLLADAPALDRAMSRQPIAVGIDAAWLLGGESGAQVFVFEMLKELARRPEIERIVMISETGGVPDPLRDAPKVRGESWPNALALGTPLVDIIHRPYHPGADVDYRRYHRVARCVAMTVLDFIAYDNPAYHESPLSWRQYQRVFGESVCLADCVFAISRHVGSRLERQFAHQLSGPVRSVPLGTDHLKVIPDTGVTGAIGPAVKDLEPTRFLLVLGNDFEHKNRDFAVRVFADMRDRGYDGLLVLAGFHLDGGSSYGHELSGAGPHANRVVRMGAVSGVEKTWLLSRADAVLYPTSSEGFGLVPFEAAALGTPTAFVRFGPLQETLPGVAACAGWQVREFADHVLGLIANPQTQVDQIRAAGAALTWAAHVDQILDGYQNLLSDGAPWRTRTRHLPGPRVRAIRTMDWLVHRATSALRRLVGRR